jgi:hypothetical protein
MKSRHLSSTTVILLLLIVVLGIVWAGVGYSAQTSVRTVGQVYLVDSNGKIVGNSPGNSDFGPFWWIEIDQKLTAIQVTPNGYVIGTLFYESENYQGTPWLETSDLAPEWPVPSAVAPPGNTLYMPSTTIAQNVRLQSALRNDGCRGAFENTGGYPLNL